jgi:hypothetical protein
LLLQKLQKSNLVIEFGVIYPPLPPVMRNNLNSEVEMLLHSFGVELL